MEASDGFEAAPQRTPQQMEAMASKRLHNAPLERFVTESSQKTTSKHSCLKGVWYWLEIKIQSYYMQIMLEAWLVSS